MYKFIKSLDYIFTAVSFLIVGCDQVCHGYVIGVMILHAYL